VTVDVTVLVLVAFPSLPARGGSVVCWGRNDVGQATPPTGTFTRIVAHLASTCGIRTDGTTVCWGGRALSPPHGPFKEMFVGQFGAYVCGVRVNASVTCGGSFVY
jgi:hypothetical protein